MEGLVPGGVITEAMRNYLALGVLVLLLLLLIVIPSLRRRSRRTAMRRLEKTLPAPRPEREDSDPALRQSRLESRLAALEAQLARRDGAASSDLSLADVEARLQAARRALDAVIAEREAQKLEVVAHETELANLRDAIATAARRASGGSAAAVDVAELRATLASETLRREAAVEEAGARLEELRQAHELIERQRLELAGLRGEVPALPPPGDEKAALLARIDALEAENRALRAGRSDPKPAASAESELNDQLKAIGAAVAEFAEPRKAGERPALPAPASDGEEGLVTRTGLAGLAARIRALQDGPKG